MNSCFCYLRIALGAWPPTTYITLGKPIGVLGRVLGDCTDDRCSLLSRWYFIASIRKSLHMLLFLTSISVSTRLTRYSRDRRGRRTCSMSCAKQSCLCSGSWFTHVTTASNTWNKKWCQASIINVWICPMEGISEGLEESGTCILHLKCLFYPLNTTPPGWKASLSQIFLA